MSDNAKMRKVRLHLSIEQVNKGTGTGRKNFFKKLLKLWRITLSVSLWFNMYSTPALILFADDLSQSLYGYFWLNELVWVLEMIRKLLFNTEASDGSKDSMTAAIEYIKGTFLLDLIATLPQVASAMNPKFAFLKIL